MKYYNLARCRPNSLGLHRCPVHLGFRHLVNQNDTTPSRVIIGNHGGFLWLPLTKDLAQPPLALCYAIQSLLVGIIPMYPASMESHSL